VRQPRGGGGLAREAGEEAGVMESRANQQLDRHPSVQLPVVALVDLDRAAGGRRRAQLVAVQ
jgi:hypothetical protein